ncbi:MAG: glycosyltransferase family 2 protein [Clostridia bacterium]|nr:glycosyltransferase family 2 protein [Clostridia bacterium]
MNIAIGIIEALLAVFSAWLMFLMIYQIVLSFVGFKRKTKDYQDHEPEARFLVLVPAHNEEKVIATMIDNLNRMDYPKELYDFIILADNCTDRTEEIARGLGAEVLVSRRESEDEPTGKPIVLQKALKALGDYHEKYDLVMFFDADNMIDLNMFREVNSQYIDSGRKADVIQCYLGCKNSKGMVAFADYVSYTITNRFMQYAKQRVGLNAAIGGTGFCVSADYLHARGGWTSLSLTEDFELQIETICEGRRLLWNNEVRIHDEKPTRLKACARQRLRWAQGRWFVSFKNTPKLIKAFFKGKISFWEFLSTFWGMYNMSPFAVLMLEALLLGILELIRVCDPTAPVYLSFATMFNFNLTSVLVMFYSIYVLFYVGDWLDNHRAPKLREIFPIFVSILINMGLGGLVNLIGLFKHRKQNVWVKTEHSINVDMDQVLAASAQASGDGREAAAEG